MTELTDSIKDSTNPGSYPSPAVGWYGVVILGFLYWVAMLDRFIISLLVEPIKADLGISDVQFGLLQGLALLISLTAFGFVFGALADKSSRRRLIFIGVTVWSLATAACGLAQNFWHLLLARVTLGAGEASISPCATSMISDLFPKEKLTMAISVYSLGASIGSGSALILGGVIIAWVFNLGEIVLPIIGELAPWQTVFIIVGLPGVLLATLVFLIPEPVRQGPIDKGLEQSNWLSAFSRLYVFMKGHVRLFLAIYIGFTLVAGLATACMAWFPVHMIRTFGWPQKDVGLYLGLVLMCAAIGGKLVTGYVVDAMYRRGSRDAQLRWFAGCLLLATPAGVAALLSANAWVFLSLIGVFMMLLMPFSACVLTTLNLVIPNNLRGTGVAAFTAFSSIFGGSIGTVLVPLISEHFFRGEADIGLGLLTLLAIACPLAAVVLMTGLKGMRTANV